MYVCICAYVSVLKTFCVSIGSYVYVCMYVCMYGTSLAMGASFDGITRTSGLTPFISQCLEWRRSYYRPTTQRYTVCMYVCMYVYVYVCIT